MNVDDIHLMQFVNGIRNEIRSWYLNLLTKKSNWSKWNCNVWISGDFISYLCNRFILYLHYFKNASVVSFSFIICKDEFPTLDPCIDVSFFVPSGCWLLIIFFCMNLLLYFIAKNSFCNSIISFGYKYEEILVEQFFFFGNNGRISFYQVRLQDLNSKIRGSQYFLFLISWASWNSRPTGLSTQKNVKPNYP